MTDPISRAELRRKLEGRDRPVVIEALPAKYYEERHLPGAINIPHDAVELAAPKLLPDKDIEIVTYCASAACRNSDIAAERLAALGYRNVRVYREGKADWIAAGLPVERGAQRSAA